MKVLEAVTMALGRQGGTLWQARGHALYYGNRKSLAYKLGMQTAEAYQRPANEFGSEPGITLAECKVPINSFSAPNKQIIDYVRGLVDGGIA